MRQSRVELVAPDPCSLLPRSNVAKQRSAALMACEAALAYTHLRHPVLVDPIRSLSSGESIPVAKRKELERLAEALDLRYLDLQKAAEERHATKDDWLPAFEQARAASAVMFATSEDAFVAASEALYEAIASMEDASAFSPPSVRT